MRYEDLLQEFSSMSLNEQLNIIERFCEKNELSGNDGLYGQLQYVKALIRCESIEHYPGIGRDIFEFAYTIWAFEKLNKLHVIDEVSRNFMKGGDYGDTSAYLTPGEGNYFKNFLLQAQIGLRLVESGINFTCADDQSKDPDYFIKEEDIRLEIKAPASKLALLQALIKGVQQIEHKGTHGIVVLTLDHMVARGMIPDRFSSLSDEIISIILSALPQNSDSKTIGVIAEWCSWDGEEAVTVVQPIMNIAKGQIENNKLKIHKVWGALSFGDVDYEGIKVANTPHIFPYGNDYEGEIDPKEFFQFTWPEL